MADDLQPLFDARCCGFVDVVRLAHGIVESPILVDFHVRARDATAHGDDHVKIGFVHQVHAFWDEILGGQPALFKQGQRMWRNRCGWMGASRCGFKAHAFGQGLGHLRTARIAHAHEQEFHGVHDRLR